LSCKKGSGEWVFLFIVVKGEAVEWTGLDAALLELDRWKFIWAYIRRPISLLPASIDMERAVLPSYFKRETKL